jgi:hypothetical protein
MCSDDRRKRPSAVEGEGGSLKAERCDATSDAVPMQQSNMQILAPSILALSLFRWPSMDVKKSGKVLREPGGRDGLVIVEGRQFPFSLTDLWQSPQLPKIGMSVEAEFNRDGKLVAIRALDARSHSAYR